MFYLKFLLLLEIRTVELIVLNLSGAHDMEA